MEVKFPLLSLLMLIQFLIYVNFTAVSSRIGQEQQFVLAAVLLCIVVDYRFARQPSVSRLKIMQ